MTTLLQKLEEAAKNWGPGAMIIPESNDILALCERERQRDAILVELVSALGGVCSLIESGELVRNIEQDGDTLAFVKQSLKITSAIAAAGNALAKAASFTAKYASL